MIGATCESCRYWSDQKARSHGGAIEAMCLNPHSHAHGQYKPEHYACSYQKAGAAIDLPAEAA